MAQQKERQAKILNALSSRPAQVKAYSRKMHAAEIDLSSQKGNQAQVTKALTSIPKQYTSNKPKKCEVEKDKSKTENQVKITKELSATPPLSQTDTTSLKVTEMATLTKTSPAKISKSKILNALLPSQKKVRVHSCNTDMGLRKGEIQSKILNALSSAPIPEKSHKPKIRDAEVVTSSDNNYQAKIIKALSSSGTRQKHDNKALIHGEG